MWDWGPTDDFYETIRDYTFIAPFGTPKSSWISRVEITPPAVGYSIPSWLGSPTGASEETITYNVTFPDGVDAEAKYELTLHDPVENLTKDTTGETRSDRDSSGVVLTGPISSANPDNRSLSITTGGAWVLESGTDVSDWFPVYGHVNRRPIITTPIQLTYAGPLDSDEHVKLSRRFAINKHTFYWDAFDAAGPIYPAPPLLKQQAKYLDVVSYQYFWDGPIDNETGL